MSHRVLAAAILGALALAACAGSDDNATGQTGPFPTTTRTEPVAEATTTAVSTSTSAPPTSAATTTTTTTVAATVYDFSAVSQIVQDFVDEHGLDGAGLVVVDRDNGIVHEEYWGTFGPDRVSLFASASKSLAAGVLLRLADQGLLDMDAPIADAVDWGSANPTITPAQLVSNSSGLVGLLPEFVYGPYLCEFLASGDLQTCGSAIFTTDRDDDQVVAPDTQFRYGSGQWQVAGALAEAVSGKSWSELIDETYVQPCGVDSLGFNNHWNQFDSFAYGYPTEFAADPSTLVPTANPNIEGGGYSTARDYAELLLMQLRDGRCGDNQVISPAANARMHADRIGPIYGTTLNQRPDESGYGLGWWVDTRPGGLVTDPGAYGAVPWLDLTDGYGAYLVMEADVMTGLDLADRLFAPVEQAVLSAR